LFPDERPEGKPANVNDLSAQNIAIPCPAHRPTVERLTGFKPRERTKSRSQLLCFQWIYERTGARHALRRIRTHVETWSAPEQAF
jgi:hypothetical protein